MTIYSRPGGAAPIDFASASRLVGRFSDSYGVMFTFANGDIVDMYSNGGDGGPAIYGVVV